MSVGLNILIRHLFTDLWVNYGLGTMTATIWHHKIIDFIEVL